jgi:hypothetical protein
LNRPLQNGYTQTVQATITVNVITFTQTNLAQNIGILTPNYSTFRYTQGTSWNTGWSIPQGILIPTAFSVNVTNNNSTGDFYVYSASKFTFLSTLGTASALPFYIVNETTFSPSLHVTNYTCGSSSSDYCVKIPSQQTITLYFAATSQQGKSLTGILSKGEYSNSLLIYGKFAASRDTTGTFYAQTIPFYPTQAS